MKKPSETILGILEEVDSIRTENEKKEQEKERRKKLKLKKRSEAFSKTEERVILPVLNEIMKQLQASGYKVIMETDKGEEGEPGHSLKIKDNAQSMELNIGFFFNEYGNYILSWAYMTVDDHFDEDEVRHLPKSITAAMVTKEINRLMTKMRRKLQKKL